ncbi:MAG: epoxyqueuosine reductase QueH [Rickettsiaceae bacterium]|nr:epoxyqueuosine reductase QueH [Rickettsiaceae bacterium]
MKNLEKHDGFALPEGSENKVLMHSCCAPCAGALMQKIKEAGIDLTIFFYNPNIHPKKEYEIRKNENIRYAEKMNIAFVDADYDVQNWFARSKGMEYQPERGIRCTACFDMRFERTALYAHENNFRVFTSSLGISRWKNMQQINECGIRAAQNYENLVYWTYNWRQNAGSAKMYEIAKQENFYKQEYCGCIYSLRDTNNWRKQNNREEIVIGEQFYHEKISN